MRRILWAAGAMLVAAAALAAPTAKSRKAAGAAPATVTPKQEHQYGTVDELVKAKLPLKTAASVEGYTVVGLKTADGTERITVVDSVDHVLTAKDADSFGRAGATGVLPAASIRKHPGWAWAPKGIQRFVMFTGTGHAQKALHDTVAKVRLTGLAGPKATLNPVTKVEFQDENGDWKTLP